MLQRTLSYHMLSEIMLTGRSGGGIAHKSSLQTLTALQFDLKNPISR